MKRILTYHISMKDEGCSILDYLKQKGYSRNILIALKKTPEGIQQNGVWAYVTNILHAGDTLVITLSETASSLHIPPICLPLSICYEDEDILVLNKPSDMPIHPSIHNYENTLANGVAWYYQNQNIPFTFRCVNRLDRDTSGLTIIAKNMLSSHLLSQQVKEKSLKREYLAIAKGRVPDTGTIDAPIAREGDSVISRCVDFTKGEHAVTHFKRLDYKNGLSLVSLHLETGRTHQIRVHMKFIGHPLIGDFLYHPENQQMKRQALHSHRLQFTHPITERPMDFLCPLPADMAVFV